MQLDEERRSFVEHHYGRGRILETILRALHEMGKDVGKLTPADVALVDEFHIRGREATVELAERAGLAPGLRVLDVGCGLGGSVRYLAHERGCRAVGVDLTAEYVEAARTLATLQGLAGATEFHEGSALELPFPDASFDAVWTEHAQMNVADKRRFYSEMARVLAPGGRIAFHDVFQGDGGEPHFPVPWAEERAISSLAPPAVARELLEELGLRVLVWEDESRRSHEWFSGLAERIRKSGPPPLGIHLLMGLTARQKIENLVRNLSERRIAVIQAVAVKPAGGRASSGGASLA